MSYPLLSLKEVAAILKLSLILEDESKQNKDQDQNKG
jgi:hypothetical protein